MKSSITRHAPFNQHNQNLLWTGVVKGLPISIGYFAIAMTFGLIAVSIGLNVWAAVSMSILVYAGASQFVALELLAAGTGLIEIVITTLILNLRHLLMSTVVAERLQATRKWSALLSFGITDETFVVSTVTQADEDEEKETELTLHPAYLGGILIVSYGGWIAGTVIGSLFAQWIPVSLATSLGVALYAMFIGLLIPSVRRSWRVGLVALISAALAWGGEAIPRLSGGWNMILATMIASTLGVILFADRGGEDRAG